MSRRSVPVAAEECLALGAEQPGLESYPSREVHLGELRVTRALPIRERRLVGPWCFLDRFGPLSFTEGMPMDVAPHPHIGLQTITWLHAGEVAHDDSLGFDAVLRPGGVNVMTSGSGIAHAERTPRYNTGKLDGVQLWTALPQAERDREPGFTHLAEVPTLEWPGGVVQVFAGKLAGASAPVPTYSPLLGADVQVHPGLALEVPLEAGFEHAILVLSGECLLEGQALDPGTLYYLGTKRSQACFTSCTGARVLLIGGPPFPETILMWWNFVARTPEEILQARLDWEGHRRFGEVRAYQGPRLAAPELTRLARPNPVS